MKKALLLIPLFCLLASPSWAAIVCGAESSTVTTADPQTLAWTPGTGSNRVAIVTIHYGDTDADNTVVSSVTSDAGGTFTLFGRENEEDGTVDLVTEIWYSTNFVDGAQTLSVDYSTAVTQSAVFAFVCTGVRQGNPWRGAAVTSSPNGATSTSLSIPSAVGDLVIDAVVLVTLPAGTAPTMGADQTELWNIPMNGDNYDLAGSTEPGVAGNVTMSWSAATSERWAHVGGSLMPVQALHPPIFFE